ncbi:hypothetical protein EDF38_2729 [Frigoribacterium sp. PhB160]|uniref:hypothetical protein n=1 Tax=Frigoribacterium sp. PhB160 TaxID=2485192 RepID=UPI000F47650B|nr:hypothetical protein [Frigoribacterium sp. PhB160]ROS57999.1 hypothetical protein EDF38_2729 [Frigoribacterium sp. PhB160]
MTPQRNTPSCLARFGALGLAAATVVTGLTLSPTAPAVAQPAPSATQEAPAEAPASPAASTPVDVSSSTPVEVTDEADLAAPTITRSTSYTNAAGQTVYRYEGTGVAGATVQHGPSRASWQDGATVGSDGTFTVETTRIPVGEQKMELRQKLDTQASAKIEVAIADMVAELPRVAVTKSTSYTDAAGQTVYRYEGTGVAGATVQHGPSRASWQDGPTVGSDGTFVLETTRIPVGEQKMELRQKLDTQASAKIEVAIADMVAELPRVAVTKSTSYTNAAGQTVYRYEGTGVAGATVQHGPSRASWQDGATVGSDGTFTVETTRIPVGEQKMELRQKLDTQASAKIEVAIADMVAELPAVTDLAGSTTINPDGSRTHRYTGKGVTGAAVAIRLGGGDWTPASATVVDGTFTFETRLTATEQTPLQVRQFFAGLVSAGVVAPLPVEENVSLPFVMESPRTGDTFTPGTATFEGTGTSGSTITVTPQRGLAPVTTTVKENGRWSVTKSLGNGTYVLDITQTSPTGAPQGAIHAFVYAPTGIDVERNFEMITPRVGDTFTPDSFVHFVGQGTPGATITLKPQGGLAEATTTVRADGFWTIRRGMGNGTYTLSVTQTVGGVVTGTPITGFVYGPTAGGDPITREFAVTSHRSGDTFPADTTVTIRGTGTPGATVTLKPQGNLAESTALVDRDGYWAAPRGMGNGAYRFAITQMLDGEVIGTPITDFVLTPAR